jgi:hypothetical protein
MRSAGWLGWSTRPNGPPAAARTGRWTAPVHAGCRRGWRRRAPADRTAPGCAGQLGDAGVERVQGGSARRAVLVGPDRRRLIGRRNDAAGQRRGGIAGGQAAGDFAAHGGEGVAGTVQHEQAQRLAHHAGFALGVFAGQLGQRGTLNGGVHLGGGQHQLCSQVGVAGRRACLQRQAQQDDEILGTQGNLGIGAGHARTVPPNAPFIRYSRMANNEGVLTPTPARSGSSAHHSSPRRSGRPARRGRCARPGSR